MPASAAPFESLPANDEQSAALQRTTPPVPVERVRSTTVLRRHAAWCIVHGDALHVLRDLPDACPHAFVTDPPYSSGGAFGGHRVKDATAKYVSTGSRNKGDVRDQRTFALWRSATTSYGGRNRAGVSANPHLTSTSPACEFTGSRRSTGFPPPRASSSTYHAFRRTNAHAPTPPGSS